MPISQPQVAAIEDAINRLAAESILAQPGRDDGLVPSYSLLGDLRDLCAAESALQEPIVATQVALEKLLDAAQPFNAPMLSELRWLVEWLPVALECAKDGQPIPPFGAASGPAPDPIELPEDAASTSDDVLLELQIAENRELLTEFHAEAVDHLQQIEAALLALDHAPDNPEALNSIFRSFHTIKGNAGFLGLVPMHTLAHEVESLLDLARNGKLTLNAAIITEILHSRDALQALTQQVAIALEKGKLPEQIVPVAHLIRAVKKLAADPSASVTPPPFGGTSAETAPSVAPFVAPIAGIRPPQGEADRLESPTELAAVVPLPGVEGEGTVPPMGVARKTVTSAVARAASATVRVNTEKLDSLMDVVGELVIVQSQLLESSRQAGDENSALQRNVAQLGRITKELQSTAMSLRMIPIKPTFQKMERLARDLARDVGKRVSFVTSGEDTELDRTVVEEIGDPLVHMVRNALDHGLETPAQRLAAGKPEVGSVHLRAYHQGSNIVIELQDDGRGIDPEKVLRKAIEKELVPAGAQLAREEILALIFAPGFSTAEKVTSVFRSRRRHGRREAEHRKAARQNRNFLGGGPWFDVQGETAAHHGDHRRARRAGGRGSLHPAEHVRADGASSGARGHFHAARQGRGPRSAWSIRADSPVAPEIQHHERCARSVGRHRRHRRKLRQGFRVAGRRDGEQAGSRDQKSRRLHAESAGRRRRRDFGRRQHRVDSRSGFAAARGLMMFAMVSAEMPLRASASVAAGVPACRYRSSCVGRQGRLPLRFFL